MKYVCPESILIRKSSEWVCNAKPSALLTIDQSQKYLERGEQLHRESYIVRGVAWPDPQRRDNAVFAAAIGSFLFTLIDRWLGWWVTVVIRTDRQVEHRRSVPRTRITNGRLTRLYLSIQYVQLAIVIPVVTRETFRICRGIPRFLDHANLIARDRQTEIIGMPSRSETLVDILRVDYIGWLENRTKLSNAHTHIWWLFENRKISKISAL